MKKPKLFLTRDRDGIHLWFSLDAPVKRERVYTNPLAAAKVRLPIYWYDGIIPQDECKEFDPREIFS